MLGPTANCPIVIFNTKYRLFSSYRMRKVKIFKMSITVEICYVAEVSTKISRDQMKGATRFRAQTQRKRQIQQLAIPKCKRIHVLKEMYIVS